MCTGVPPTARQARTGLETPPGISSTAVANRDSEREPTWGMRLPPARQLVTSGLDHELARLPRLLAHSQLLVDPSQVLEHVDVHRAQLVGVLEVLQRLL